MTGGRSQRFLVLNQRSKPLELFLPDGSVLLVDPGGSVEIDEASRSAPQLRVLERERAVQVHAAPAPAAAARVQRTFPAEGAAEHEAPVEAERERRHPPRPGGSRSKPKRK